MKTLQFQNSLGNWVDCESRRDQFLDRCVQFNKDINSHEEAIAAMDAGKTLRNDSADWYSNCRMFDKEEDNRKMDEYLDNQNKLAKKMITCRFCGQIGTKGGYPFSTLGGQDICDDCV